MTSLLSFFILMPGGQVITLNAQGKSADTVDKDLAEFIAFFEKRENILSLLSRTIEIPSGIQYSTYISIKTTLFATAILFELNRLVEAFFATPVLPHFPQIVVPLRYIPSQYRLVSIDLVA